MGEIVFYLLTYQNFYEDRLKSIFENTMQYIFYCHYFIFTKCVIRNHPSCPNNEILYLKAFSKTQHFNSVFSWSSHLFQIFFQNHIIYSVVGREIIHINNLQRGILLMITCKPNVQIAGQNLLSSLLCLSFQQHLCIKYFEFLHSQYNVDINLANVSELTADV